MSKVTRFRPYYFDQTLCVGHAATMRQNTEGSYVLFSDYDALVDLLREGRNQSYGVMGIGTAKLRALEDWFAKVDAILGSTSGTAPSAEIAAGSAEAGQPWRCQNMAHKRYLMFQCTECSPAQND